MVDKGHVAVAQVYVYAVAGTLELAGSSHAHEGALLLLVREGERGVGGEGMEMFTLEFRKQQNRKTQKVLETCAPRDGERAIVCVCGGALTPSVLLRFAVLAIKSRGESCRLTNPQEREVGSGEERV